MSKVISMMESLDQEFDSYDGLDITDDNVGVICLNKKPFYLSEDDMEDLYADLGHTLYGDNEGTLYEE